MKIALLSSTPVPRVYGGMDRLLEGLTEALRRRHPTDLITIPVDERTADGVLKGYYDFYNLDVSAYDLVISYKAPSYMVRHPVQVLYLSHRMRVFYDLWEPRDREHTKMRRLIHWMDNWAMAPDRIPEIFTVGNAVSKRLLRWGGIESKPVHHPSTFTPGEPRPGEFFFAAGRLHEWKRFDLIIEAFKLAKTHSQLVIAGSGPDEARLRDLAKGDPRIIFRGQVDEQGLRDDYARSIAHLFTPINEDLGMITWESFLSGKPVLTTTDAGEPAEIVREGVTGFVTEPTPEAVAAKIDWMDRHLDKVEAMAPACREQVAEVTWDRLVDTLLDAGDRTRNRKGTARPISIPRNADPEKPLPAEQRIRLVVTDNQMIDPPVGGGRIRIWELYRHLPADFVTTYIGCHDHPGPLYRDQWMAPNFREIVMPLTALHFRMHELWRRLTRGDATVDVTIPLLLGRCSPRYHRLIAEHAKNAHAVIVSHPWVTPFVPRDLQIPFVYDSHNCEAAVKKALLSRTLAGRYLAHRVAQCEAEALRRSSRILACSPMDSAQFVERYGANAADIVEIPNGVDCRDKTPCPVAEKAALKRALGLPDTLLAIFVGSDYEPNRVAVDFLVRRLAPAQPGLTIGIIGGVGPAWQQANASQPIPANVRILGQVDSDMLRQLYHAADLGLNPMTLGSGTNIKMLDFMAAGLPIITTATGARGLAGEPGTHWLQADLDAFAAAVAELSAAPDRMAAMGAAARAQAEAVYDWPSIAERLAGTLRRLVAHKATIADDVVQPRDPNGVPALS